jgi:hypothetical protein
MVSLLEGTHPQVATRLLLLTHLPLLLLLVHILCQLGTPNQQGHSSH